MKTIRTLTSIAFAIVLTACISPQPATERVAVFTPAEAAANGLGPTPVPAATVTVPTPAPAEPTPVPPPAN